MKFLKSVSRYVVSSTNSKRVVVGYEENWKQYLSSLSFQDIAQLGVLQKEKQKLKEYAVYK
ncbi:MAG: hypothetical protein WCI04_04140 [archaeon]